jgi:hypothetical protein
MAAMADVVAFYSLFPVYEAFANLRDRWEPDVWEDMAYRAQRALWLAGWPKGDGPDMSAHLRRLRVSLHVSMANDDLAEAWEAIHANTPEGWYVGRPGYEERYRQWSMYAFDPRRRQWSASGHGSGQRSDRLNSTASETWRTALGELKAGRWPM